MHVVNVTQRDKSLHGGVGPTKQQAPHVPFVSVPCELEERNKGGELEREGSKEAS